MSPSRAVYGAAGGGWLVSPRNQLGYPSRRRRAGLVRQWRQEAALPAPTGRSSPSSAPWGLEMPRSQGACCQGPLRERLHRAVRVPSGERRFEGRCQGPPRGATAPDRQGPYGERRLKRKGTVGVPSGSDGALLSGSPSGSDGSKGTVRVPSGSGGAVLSGSLRGATVRRVLSGSPQGAIVPQLRLKACAARGIRMRRLPTESARVVFQPEGR